MSDSLGGGRGMRSVRPRPSSHRTPGWESCWVNPLGDVCHRWEVSHPFKALFYCEGFCCLFIFPVKPWVQKKQRTKSLAALRMILVWFSQLLEGRGDYLGTSASRQRWALAWGWLPPCLPRWMLSVLHLSLSPSSEPPAHPSFSLLSLCLDLLFWFQA